MPEAPDLLGDALWVTLDDGPRRAPPGPFAVDPGRIDVAYGYGDRLEARRVVRVSEGDTKTLSVPGPMLEPKDTTLIVVGAVEMGVGATAGYEPGGNATTSVDRAPSWSHGQGVGTVTYVAQAGDYLVKIAEEHGTTWQAIWNHPGNAEHRRRRGSPDVLYPGDVLQIPVASPAPPPPATPPAPPSPPTPLGERPTPGGDDWPYPRIEDQPPTEPTWVCARGDCICHPVDEGGERIAHELVFCDARGRRIRNARCRVVENGRLLNEGDPKASETATLTVEVHPSTKALLLQWAPEGTPRDHPYPYEKAYHLDVGETAREGVERRLENLGFCTEDSLFDNICAFERAYQLGETGDVDRIEPVLLGFHDEGLLPPIPPPLPTPAQAPSPSPAPTSGNRPGVAPGVRPAGTVAATQLLTITLRLKTRYLLTEDAFLLTGAPWPGGISAHAYDEERVVQELGGTSKAQLTKDPTKKWRWDGRARQPVAKAKVTLSVSEGESFIATKQLEQPTKNDGAATFVNVPMNFENFALGAPANAFIRVEPPDGLKSPGRAGPDWPRGAIRKDFLYRGFSMALHFDGDGVLQADSVQLFDVSPPPHAVLVSELPIKPTKKGFVIDVDWRPDWARGKSRRRTIDSRYVFQELADPPSETVAEPLLVLHETGNQNVHTGTIHNFFHKTVMRDSEGKVVTVSAHYVVDLDGHAVKMVDETQVAHHAAPSVWQGRTATNEFSVGIEICHTNVSLNHPGGKATGEDDSRRGRRFPEEQLQTVRRLCDQIVKKYKVKPSRVVGHSDVNAKAGILELRNDPSEMFDWKSIEKLQIALEPRPYQGSDPMLLALRAATPEIAKSPGTLSKDEAKIRGDKILRVKELLHELGYAVAKAAVLKGTPPGQLTQRLAKPKLTTHWDAGLEAAVKAFQLRYFSGERRRYLFRTEVPTTPGVKPPPIGTLDQATLTAIVDVWNDMQVRG